MFGAGRASASIAKGDKAPDFSAQDQSGNTVSLSDFIGKSAVTLFFYPKGMLSSDLCGASIAGQNTARIVCERIDSFFFASLLLTSDFARAYTSMSDYM